MCLRMSTTGEVRLPMRKGIEEGVSNCLRRSPRRNRHSARLPRASRGRRDLFVDLIRRCLISSVEVGMPLLAIRSISRRSCGKGRRFRATLAVAPTRWLKSAGADSVAGPAQFTGDVTEVVDAVDDDTDTRDTYDLTLESVLHLVCWDFTIEVDDVVFDECRDVLCAFEFAGGS